MFYIVESESQLESLTSYCREGCYVEVIPVNYNIHPTLNDVCAVYVHPVDMETGFIIPVNHSEGLNVEKDSISTILSQLCSIVTTDKKDFLYYFKSDAITDISLLYTMTYFDKLEIPSPLDRFSWFYNKYGIRETNKIVPLSLLYEFYEQRFSKIKEHLSLEKPDSFEFYNDLTTRVFQRIEKNGVGVNKQFLENFTPRNPRYNIANGKTFTKYNLYNTTSRPTNAFNSVNFAAIPKTPEHRESFVPQNDKFIEFDFDGYHVRLLCEQINYPLTKESAHKQLAKQYFGKEEINDDEYKQAKQINFQAVYGKIPEEYANIEIFQRISNFIASLWEKYQSEGRVLAPISGKPFTKHLRDMYPQKLMNYIMQSLETSRNILILDKVLDYLEDKNTKVVLYTYDAVLFDYSKEDGQQVLIDLERILSEDNKYPVNYKSSASMVL